MEGLKAVGREQFSTGGAKGGGKKSILIVLVQIFTRLEIKS